MKAFFCRLCRLLKRLGARGEEIIEIVEMADGYTRIRFGDGRIETRPKSEALEFIDYIPFFVLRRSNENCG